MRSLGVLFATLLSATVTFAGNGIWSRAITLADIDYNVSYGIGEPAPQVGVDQLDYANYSGLIYLDYTRKEHSDISFTGESWYIDLTLSYVENGSPVTKILQIKSDQENSEFIYSDFVKLDVLDNIDSYSVTVKSISGGYYDGNSWTTVNDPQNDPNFPTDIDLRLELRPEEWYHLEQDVASSDLDLARIKFDNAEYRAHWSFIQGAEEYDFEWVWIDDYSQEHDDIAALTGAAYDYEMPFKLKEPSRVRTWKTHHVLDKTYSTGTLYFRVRPVSKYLASSNGGIIEQVKLGRWSYFSSLSNFDPETGAYNTNDVVKYVITSANRFEWNKNWSYSVAFAEDGKNVSSVTFYDGSQRARQNLSYNSTDDITLIGESKYDYEGRQTVRVIPAPVSGRSLGYRSRFNLIAGTSISEVLDDHHLDIENYTSAQNLPLETEDDQNTSATIGAAQYFSSDNKFTDDLFRNAIPDAYGYVYSQTIYRNDGSGRIEQIGGLGHEFQVGGDHVVRTFYGSPTATELIRLFGSNVPEDLDGYRKEMVIDANGQMSVTYYNKRGQVIATGLSGDSPDNLIELAHTSETYTTDLLANNTAVDDYTLVSEHTFLNMIPHNSVTLNYELNGDLEEILGGNVTLHGVSFSMQDLCATCRYDLRIDVLDIDGNHVANSPYEYDIDPSGECYDETTGANLTTNPAPTTASLTQSLIIAFPAISEYRIIKTLSVDQESMQASFENQLELSSLNNPQNFIDDYTELLDFSGCFYSCEDYCIAFHKFAYESTNGFGTWDTYWGGLTALEQDGVIADCLADNCDTDDLFENFDTDDAVQNPYVNPYETACQAQRSQMLQQISPGGVFYNDQNPNSEFWANVLADANLFNGSTTAVVNINGAQYDYAKFRDETYFVDEMAVSMLPSHREYCHIEYCEDLEATLLYENGLLDVMLNATFPSTSGVFDTPYDETFTVGGVTFSSGDPFIGYSWNGTSELEDAITNYYSYNGGLTPSNTYDDSYWPYISSTSFSGFNSTNHKTLEDFIIHLINSNAQDDDAQNPSQLQSDSFYEFNAIMAFKGIYSQIKQEILKEYKESQSPSCVYQTDENKIFHGPMTQAEMEEQIENSISEMLNSSTCADIALQNVANWISQMDATCLDDLENAGFYDPLYTDNDLANSVNSSNLEQILYDYSLATCPENTNGWFYNPDEDDSGADPPVEGETEYDAFHLLLSNYGCSSTVNFEVSIPASIEYSVTNQEFDDCFFEFIAALNDGIDAVNAVLPSPNYDDITINSTNYPGIDGACSQTTGTLTTTNNNGSTEFSYNDGGSGCGFEIELYLLSSTLTSVSSSDIDFLDNPTKHDDFTINGTNLGDIVTFNAHLFTGDVISVYFPASTLVGNTCIRLGSFDNLYLMDWDIIPAIDESQYEQDCIDALLGQAQIDAQQMYNEFLQGLMAQFAESMKSCITSVNESFTMEYDLDEYQYTLYYYDLASNLVQTVPPEGVDVLDASHFDSDGVWDQTEPVHSMETRYRYNGLNTLISQFTPDGGTSNFVHDELYRVRYSQNARQLADDMASYTKYDPLGRIVEAGEFYDVTNFNDTDPASNIAFLETKTEDNNYPEIGTEKVLDYTHTYYEVVYNSTIEDLFEDEEQKNLRNAIGAVMHRQADYDGNGDVISGTEVISVISYSYDPHKNVDQCVSTNYHLADLGQEHKMVEYDYDLISGNVNEVIYQRGAEDEYRHRYHYDANNRLVRAFTSRDGGENWEMDAKYFYFLHGPLARVETGHDKVQGTDYAYNLLGWLKGVNSNTLTEDRDLGADAYSGDNLYGGIDVFGFSLGYFGDGNVSTTADKMDEDYISITGATAFANTAAETNVNLGAKAELWNGNISNMVTAMRDYDENAMDVLMNNYQYDQLQRIRYMDVYYDPTALTNNNFNNSGLYMNPGTGQGAYQTSYTFDGNGNLLTLQRHGNDQLNFDMDNFSYKYDGTIGTAAVESNQLNYVSDNISAGSYSSDIDGQSLNNYTYDESGQLIGDVDEDIDLIEWTVTGKVKRIDFSSTSGKDDIKFIYNPMDMRIAKIVYLNTDHTEMQYTYYSYDPQGNVMATYDRHQILTYDGTNDAEPHEYSDELVLSEHMIYGASRLGVHNQNKLLVSATITQNYIYTPNLETGIGLVWSTVTQETFDRTYREVERKYYEFSNHLGNVLEVITDRKIGYDNGTYNAEFGTKTSSTTDGTYDVYIANVVSYSDYYPYGMLLPGRHGSAGDEYRYGFQGQEMDDEIKGEGNSVNYKYRMHDPRIGRFFAVDPLAPKYPHYTPYGFSGNHVINSVELEGLEDVEVYNRTPEMEKAKSANRRYSIDGLNYNVNRTDNWDSDGNRTSVDIKDRDGNLIISYSDPSHINAKQINRLMSAKGDESSISTISAELPESNQSGLSPTIILGTTTTGGEMAGPVGALVGLFVGVASYAINAEPIDIPMSITESTSITHPPFAIPLEYTSTDGVNTFVDGDGYVVLFRGVSENHPAYADALQGKAIPRGGHDSELRHNLGNTNSVYTSWTVSPWVAYQFATDNQKAYNGVVLTKRFHRSEITISPDKFHQGEVLIRGNVYHAIPVPIVRDIFAQ